MAYQSILETVGNTPLIRLNRIGSYLQCNLFAKCEFFNPGGSLKDRIGVRMLLEAEKSGRIKPGDTLIEPTSGNTGIGIALAGATKGYNIIITMPEKMSREKQVVLEALGAKIIRTPTEAAWDSPESHIGVAKKLQKELPNAHILDQYSNEDNPLAHYHGTAEEIIADLDGQVDMIVIAAGTGGTITGCARKLREVNPNCIVVGADPEGSILAGGSRVGTYKVEGIGYDFIPDVLDRSLIDTWVKTNDRQSFLLARRLIREEGLLCGGSSGAALYAALKEAQRLDEGQNCVVILPDGVRNYLTKFVDNKWMADNRFSTIETVDATVGDMVKQDTKPTIVCLDVQDAAQESIQLMREKGFSQIPITKEGKVVGMLYEESLLELLLSEHASVLKSDIEHIMTPNVPKVNLHTPLSTLQELLLNSGCAVIINDENEPLNIVTKIDFVEWISNQKS